MWPPGPVSISTHARGMFDILYKFRPCDWRDGSICVEYLGQSTRLKAIAISIDKTLVSSFYFTCRKPHTSLKGIDDPVIRTQLYRCLVECQWNSVGGEGLIMRPDGPCFSLWRDTLPITHRVKMLRRSCWPKSLFFCFNLRGAHTCPYHEWWNYEIELEANGSLRFFCWAVGSVYLSSASWWAHEKLIDVDGDIPYDVWHAPLCLLIMFHPFHHGLFLSQ